MLLRLLLLLLLLMRSRRALLSIVCKSATSRAKVAGSGSGSCATAAAGVDLYGVDLLPDRLSNIVRPEAGLSAELLRVAKSVACLELAHGELPTTVNN